MVNLCLKPEPRENVPEGKKILNSLLAQKIKSMGNDLYQFIPRMCANGSKQDKGIDFDHSWSPTIDAGGCRMTLMYAAVFHLMLAMIDVVNCFQNTLQVGHGRLIITAPSYYLSWFRKKYP